MARKVHIPKVEPSGNLDAFDSVQEKRIESDEPLLWKEVRYRCECKPDHVRTEPAGRDKPDSLRCPQCQYQNAMKIVVVNT